jgi:serine protease
MRLRSAAAFSSLAILAALSGCADEGYKTTDLSTRLVVDPLFLGIIPPAPPVQYTATIGGTAVPVTWESSDPGVATVSASGLVTAVDYGFTAITATMTTDNSRKKSASLSVKPPGTTLASGIAKTAIEGEIGDYLLYHILVPAGATNLVFQISGGTGDFDIYTKFGAPPTYSDWECRPWAFGNNETCTHPNPTAGFWFAMLDVYEDGGGVSLVATITAP